MTHPHQDSTCAFCKIVQGEADSIKILETRLSYAFLALPQPLSPGHTLVVPKYHAAKMHDLPNRYLKDLIKVAKQVALLQEFEEYNILQNNGKTAYQSVFHVHFHVIQKPDADSGLVVQWPLQKPEKDAAADRKNILDSVDGKGKKEHSIEYLKLRKLC